MLERAAPPVGSAGNAAPAEIRLQFSEPIELPFSQVSVAGPAGAVALSPLATAADRRILVVKPVHALARGVYRVTWRVVSSDTHTTQGDYTFRIGPKP